LHHAKYLCRSINKTLALTLSYHKIFYSFLFLLLITTGSVYSQQRVFPFKDIVHLTVENGLSNNGVQQLMQDKDGFMWFATYFGLNRYDGNEFKVFNYDPSKKYSISPGYFTGAMKQDNNGILWLNSDNNGFYSFNPRSGNVIQYRHIPGNSNSLVDDITYDLCIDKNGIVWIATESGLDAYDSQHNIFHHFIHHVNDSTSVSNNSVLGLCLDDDNNLYMITDAGGIDHFNTSTGKVTNHFDNNPSEKPIGDLQIRTHHLSRGNNGILWISGTANGITGYSYKDNKWFHFSHDDKNPFSLSSNSTDRIFEDHAGNLWVSTFEGDLNFLKYGTNNFYHLKDIGGNFFEDNENNIWIASGAIGITIIHTQQKSFECYVHDRANNHSLTDNHHVCAFYENSDGTFLIGSYGVDIFKPKTGTFQSLQTMQHGKNILAGKAIFTIYQDKKGINWFCTENGGLISYDKKTNVARSYEYDEKDTESLGAISCAGIIEDLKGRYWVAVWTGGLESFNPQSGKFRSFKVHEGKNSISTNSVGGLMIDSEGILYICSWDGGLITFNTDSETFKIYRHSADDPFSISSNITSSFFQSNNGIIWIGTIGGGLNAFNPVTKKFRSFTTKDGLCNDGIQSITPDNNGNIWIGTINGISCFTPPSDPFNFNSTFHFRNYNTSDGIAGNEISFFGAYKSNDGKIYFGTDAAGMFCFNPDDLRENKFLPPVRFTDFKLFNRSVNSNDSTRILTSPIEIVKEIKLKYDQNVISFSFAALNYIHPEKNKYAYKLENFDKDWIYTDATKRFANYTNLDPGEYIFKVKGSNNDGVWNPQEASIKLFITPPYWATWWFRFLAAVAVAATVYALYRFRLNQLLRLHKVRNKISSDLHDDLGSTLSSISVYTEIVRKQSKENLPMLDKIGESSRKMIESMSDIVWAINPDNDSFENLIERMRSFTHEMLSMKNIEYTFEADEKLNTMKLKMDQRKNIFLIFKEAIHNLVKYSEATHAKIILAYENNKLLLSLHDNGKGFDRNSILTDDQKRGGNGLKNMHRRAKEIEADLRIASEAGKGTSIELLIKT